MAFTALYEANVLYPPGLRDLLVQLGQTGLLRARWTEPILDEMVRSILRRRPDLDELRLERTRTLMCDAVADCLVTGYEPLIDSLALPDIGDRHGLAAAIPVRRTRDRHRQPRRLSCERSRTVQHRSPGPDQFVLDLVDRAPASRDRCAATGGGTSELPNPPRTVDDLLDEVSTRGITPEAGALRSSFDG